MGLQENDILYRRGFQKSIEKGIKKAENEIETKYVTNLLLGTDLSIAKIASIVKVSEYFVKK